MLDQSFSAHNFDIIYRLESRKGNIDIKDMPEDYLSTVKAEQDIKDRLKELKSEEKTEETPEKIDTCKTELKEATQHKQEVLRQCLDSVATAINEHGFKFTLNKYIDDEGKEVFKYDNSSLKFFFASKQLQHNIKRTFNVQQSGRHNILSNIKTFLNSSIPVYVIRTDINGFYESIPQDILMPMVFGNSLLSSKSKAFIKGIIKEYETKKDKSLVQPNKGVPRGIGISAYLSELYLRNLDSEIKSRKEVMYYARYVDDIFIILSNLPVNVTLIDYYAQLTESFKNIGLTLKQPGDPKKKCWLIDLYSKKTTVTQSFDYIGYKLIMHRTEGYVSTKYALSDKKKEKYRNRIDNLIKHFEELSKKNIIHAHKDLFDSLNYITGNFYLLKTKSRVKVGLYYNNDLLDCIEDLDELTDYLHTHEINLSSGLKDADNLKIKIEKKIARFDFRERWQSPKYYKFTMSRINEIQSWL